MFSVAACWKARFSRPALSCLVVMITPSAKADLKKQHESLTRVSSKFCWLDITTLQCSDPRSAFAEFSYMILSITGLSGHRRSTHFLDFHYAVSCDHILALCGRRNSHFGFVDCWECQTVVHCSAVCIAWCPLENDSQRKRPPSLSEALHVGHLKI